MFFENNLEDVGLQGEREEIISICEGGGGGSGSKKVALVVGDARKEHLSTLSQIKESSTKEKYKHVNVMDSITNEAKSGMRDCAVQATNLTTSLEGSDPIVVQEVLTHLVVAVKSIR